MTDYSHSIFFLLPSARGSDFYALDHTDGYMGFNCGCRRAIADMVVSLQKLSIMKHAAEIF